MNMIIKEHNVSFTAMYMYMYFLFYGCIMGCFTKGITCACMYMYMYTAVHAHMYTAVHVVIRPLHTRRNRRGPLLWNRNHVMKSQICGVCKWPLRNKSPGTLVFDLRGPDLLQNFAPLSRSPRSCVWNVNTVRNHGPWFLQGHWACALRVFMFGTQSRWLRSARSRSCFFCAV